MEAATIAAGRNTSNCLRIFVPIVLSICDVCIVPMKLDRTEWTHCQFDSMDSVNGIGSHSPPGSRFDPKCSSLMHGKSG
jgi:hypothetical protein